MDLVPRPLSSANFEHPAYRSGNNELDGKSLFAIYNLHYDPNLIVLSFLTQSFSFVRAVLNLALDGAKAFRPGHRRLKTIVKSPLHANSHQNFMDLVPRPYSSANSEQWAIRAGNNELDGIFSYFFVKRSLCLLLYVF